MIFIMILMRLVVASGTSMFGLVSLFEGSNLIVESDAQLSIESELLRYVVASDELFLDVLTEPLPKLRDFRLIVPLKFDCIPAELGVVRRAVLIFLSEFANLTVRRVFRVWVAEVGS